jgi:hypothetical protein
VPLRLSVPDLVWTDNSPLIVELRMFAFPERLNLPRPEGPGVLIRRVLFVSPNPSPHLVGTTC